MTNLSVRNIKQEKLYEHWQKIFEHQKQDFRASSLGALIRKYLKLGNVLDIGCGTGQVALELLQTGYKVTAIDVSQEMVNLTNLLVKRHGYQNNIARVMNINNIADKFGEKQFDNIVCLDVLEHIENDVFILRQIYKVLKPNGHLVLTLPALSWLYGKRDRDLGHFRRYNKKEITVKLLNCGFHIREIRYWNFIGVLPYLSFEKILKRRVYEGMRYSQKGTLKRFINKILRIWFLVIENKISFHLGLTLLVVAFKRE